MSGGKVEKYVSTSSHGGMVAVVSNDYSRTYVAYPDYAAAIARAEAAEAALQSIADHPYRATSDQNVVDHYNMLLRERGEITRIAQNAIAAQQAEGG